MTTDESDLDEIRAHLRNANGIGLDETVARHYRKDVPELCSELSRLRKTVDAVRQYAEDRDARRNHRNHTVDSVRIASDLLAILDAD